MKQLERRVAKIEAQTMGLRAQRELAELRKVTDFVTGAEINALAEIGEENDEYLDRWDELKARAAIRRQQYPRLWSLPHWEWRTGWSPPLAELWSVECDMEAFRSEIGKHWEWVGFSFLLDKLGARDLEIMDYLRNHGVPVYTVLRFCGSWQRVRQIATLPEIEQTISKVWFDSRVSNADRRVGYDQFEYETVNRQLILADLKLDPADFQRPQ